MKKSILTLGLLISTTSFAACINVHNHKICTGDIVFKGSKYYQGARVLGINFNNNKVTVKSNAVYDHYVQSEAIENLYISRVLAAF